MIPLWCSIAVSAQEKMNLIAQKDMERIKKHINSTAKNQLTSRLKKSYVKISKSSRIEIDLDKLNYEKQFDGFFGIQTNLKKIVPQEILEIYRGLWQVEQTFRIVKTNLEKRPVFHYTTRRIKAHFLICYMALTLIRYVEFNLKINGIKIPPEELSILLSRMKKVKITNADNDVFELLEDPP